MLDEEPVQVARTDAEAAGELLHAARVQLAFMDQPECAAHRGRGAEPSRRARRRLRTTTQAGSEARFGGRSGGREIADAGRLRTDRRADRPAIDMRAGDRDEESPVEARIAGQARAIADGGIEMQRQGGHGLTLRRCADKTSHFRT